MDGWPTRRWLLYPWLREGGGRRRSDRVVGDTYRSSEKTVAFTTDRVKATCSATRLKLASCHWPIRISWPCTAAPITASTSRHAGVTFRSRTTLRMAVCRQRRRREDRTQGRST